ncbi:MAG: DUF2783 domain-containing protein [Burkholderiales bacterium]|nr:DUF2783 domain-containing protein [Burkholderiales bacterium]
MKTSMTQADADRFYEALLDAHLGLNAEQSQLFQARLILLLAQQVPDATVLCELIALARQSPELP